MIIIPKEIQDKMLSDSVEYNIRLHFPNGERTDVCNNMIVEGSAKLTESLVSQDELKFGLCESPTFECETVGVGNITGCTFELFYEIICDANISGAEFRTDLQSFVFAIKKGVFVVASAERQADMQHRKIVAYGGGSAANWDLPLFERYKAKSYASYGYNCDISKVIQTLFYCEAESELELEEGYSQYDIITTDRNYIGQISVLNKHNLKFTTEQIMKADFVEYDINAIVEKVKADIIENPYFETIKDEAIKELDKKREYKPIIYSQNLPSFEAVKNEPYYFNITSRDTQYVYMTYKVPYAIKITFRELLSYKELYTKTYPIRDNVKLYKCKEQLASYPIEYTTKTLNDYINIDLRKYLENFAEFIGKIARVNNNNVLEFVDLKKQFYLLPNDDLMPSEQLKPLGVGGTSIVKSQYSSLWYQEDYAKPYGAVYCAYKDTDNNDMELTVYLEGYDEDTDISEYKIYDLSSNAIIQENGYTVAQMQTILQNVAESISGVSYVPLKLQCVSVPFVETGDTLEVLTQANDSITTIVMKRTLSGESYITDEITSV